MSDSGFALPSRLLVAIGGNAIHPADIAGTSAEQRVVANDTALALLPLAMADMELVITHGNGPVVGRILMRQVLARERIPPLDLDICVAHTQGGIAYLLMQALENALRGAGSERHVAVLLTQVEVDGDDPAFGDPSKPVGPFFDETAAKAVGAEMGWRMKEDAGRGWRHVVPSPRPRHVTDLSLVRDLTDRGSVVIAGGGGGIPVIRDDTGARRGVAAVVDKDLTSAMMANALGIPVLLILTAVAKVAVDFGTPRQRDLDRTGPAELRRLMAEGHFPAGSMGPKIEAAIQFLDNGGERVVIGHLNEPMAALRGETGTQILPDGR